MAKKWVAFKRDLEEPLEWLFLADQRVVFHRVEVVESINTPDGSMVAVKIRNKADLADPDTDVIALVGRAKKVRKSGMVDPQSPELWYWDDKFWLKAVDSSGSDYYNKKLYLVYEVVIVNEDDLLGGLKHHWQGEAEEESDDN